MTSDINPVEDLDYLDEDEDCMCEFPATCGGTGMVECDGCGGDFCVCACGGGQMECPGCPECPDVDQAKDLADEAAAEFEIEQRRDLEDAE